jgi:hypothetical protein
VDGIAPVSQAGHQLHPHARDTVVVVAPLARLPREAVPGHGRNDDIEAVFGQRADHVHVFHDRAWPAVEQQQRSSVRLFGTLMDEVNVDAVDESFELIELIQPLLLRPPVVLVAPVVGQGF